MRVFLILAHIPSILTNVLALFYRSSGIAIFLISTQIGAVLSDIRLIRTGITHIVPSLALILAYIFVILFGISGAGCLAESSQGRDTK